jgi:hypothetical protein
MTPSIILLLAGVVGAADADMAVRPDDDGYLITASEPFLDDPEGALSERLDLIAKGECRELSVRWGQFRYNSSRDGQGVRRLTEFSQRFTCFDPENDPFVPVPADWKASGNDEFHAMGAAMAMYDAVTSGDSKTALSMFETGMDFDPDEWLSSTELLRNPGEGYADVTYLGWLINPRSTPHPGAFADLRITGFYEEFEKACVDMVLYRAAPERFLVTSLVVSAIRKEWVESGEVSQNEVEKSCE